MNKIDKTPPAPKPADEWHAAGSWRLPLEKEGVGINLAAALDRAFEAHGFAAAAAARWVPGSDSGRVAIFLNPGGGYPFARDKDWAAALARTDRGLATLQERSALLDTASQVINDLESQLATAKKVHRFAIESPPQPAPPPMHIDVHVAAPNVTVQAPPAVVIPAPLVTVAAAAPTFIPAPLVTVEAPKAGRREVKHERDASGKIVRSVVTEA